MREVLRDFEGQPPGARDRAPAKDRAFYLALRNLLQEIVRTPQVRQLARPKIKRGRK